MKLSTRFFLIALVYFVALTGAHAATLNVSSTGILLGASGVIVNGASYDVSFQDGTCAGLYNGCNDTSDFLFKTATEARAASQALLDQVLIDVPAQGYNFDSDPSKTSGCTLPGECQIYTPTASSSYYQGTKYEYVVYADNWNPVGYVGVDGVSQGNLLAFIDTDPTNGHPKVWAVWSPASATPAVPVPAAAWLFGSGLLGLGGLARKRVSRS